MKIREFKTTRDILRSILAVSSVLSLTLVANAVADDNALISDLTVSRNSILEMRSRRSKAAQDELEVTLVSNVKFFSRVGEVLRFRYTVTNGSNFYFRNKVLIGDSVATVVCPDVSRRGFSPGTRIVCESKYVVTDADIEAGEIRHAYAALNGGTISRFYEAFLCSSMRKKECESESQFICSNEKLSLGGLISRPQCNAQNGRVSETPNLKNWVSNCVSISGVVFKDINQNGAFDKNEPGIAGAELYTRSGDFITTRADGFYDLTCEQVENHNLAANFILKLDQNSLPSGYLVSTKSNLEIGSRGSGPLKFDYPVDAPREVHLNLRGDAFRKNSTNLLTKWQSKMQTLLDELGSGPAFLKIRYSSRTDPFVLAESRTETVRQMIKTMWDQRNNGRKLSIEAIIEGKMLEDKN
jgi:hypothetical protein